MKYARRDADSCSLSFNFTRLRMEMNKLLRQQMANNNGNELLVNVLEFHPTKV